MVFFHNGGPVTSQADTQYVSGSIYYLSHNGPQIPWCNFCQKRFLNEQSLQQHLASPAHTIPCEQCGKTFSSQQALKQHLNSGTHTKCNFCDRSFRDRHSLQQHIDAVHHDCPFCDRGFETQNALSQHIADTHTRRTIR